MKSFTFAIAAAASLVTFADLAHAGPFFTEEELFEMAEIVVDVEVVGNECMGASEDVEGVHRIYKHTISTVEVVKGEPSAEMSYVISETEWSEEYGQPGCTEVAYVLPAGWTGRLYLNDAGDGKVAIVDWGGAVESTPTATTDELPVCEPKSGVFPNLPPGGDDLSGSDSTESDAQGCSTSGSSPADGWLALGMVGLALAAARRRRAG